MALYDPNEFPVEAPAISEVADKLDEARRLIELGWLQHIYAKDADGRCVDPDDERAASFCVIGALSRVHGKKYHLFREFAGVDHLMRVTRCGIPEGLSVWNDRAERTQAEVVEAFRKAAELARAEAR